MTRFTFDIDLTAEPVTGTLREEDGTEHAFVGWLGIADVLGRIAERESAIEVGPADIEEDR